MKSSQFRHWGLIALLSGAPVWSWGETLSPRDAVTLTTKGTPPKTLTGEIVRQNLKGLQLKCNEGPVSLSWGEVETVDGRPVLEHVQRLKEIQKDVLCPDCKGGLVTTLCPECLGLGKVCQKTRACDTCRGTGNSTSPCKAKGCNQGKVVCPGPCIKQSVGIWKEFQGFGPCRAFVIRAGANAVRTWGISTGHIGEVYEFTEIKPFGFSNCATCRGSTSSPCGACRGAGTFVKEQPRSLGRCKICGDSPLGRGVIACAACGASGFLPCAGCRGAKAVPDLEAATPCPSCAAGVVSCPTCSGTGLCDPKSPPRSPGPLWYAAIRKALAKMGDGPLGVTDRLTLKGGRCLDGGVLLKTDEGTILAMTSPAGDFRVLWIHAKHILKQEALKDRPADSKTPASAPAESPAVGTPPAPAPKASPDTVVLKNGTVLTGRIVIRSDKILMIETSEGKRVKVEVDQVTEVRSESKNP